MLDIIIIILLVSIIVGLQIYIFCKSKKDLKSFEEIFPTKAEDEWGVLSSDSKNELKIIGKKDFEAETARIKNLNSRIEQKKTNIRLQGLRLRTVPLSEEERKSLKNEIDKSQEELESLTRQRNLGIKVKDYRSTNLTRTTIIQAINNYLAKNNSSVSDFKIIKDIVDRNSDAEEDGVQTQIPIPLYLGLMGTMLGIIVGVVQLFLSDSVNALFAGNQAGIDGVSHLLSGVALAMLASLCGVGLTTWGSWLAKTSKSKVEKAKHSFLSWMQAELLPVMSTDATSTIKVVAESLNGFNKDFKENAETLNDTLEGVIETSKGQAEILQTIQSLKVNDIATANIKVYERLKNCTTEIGKLSEYLTNVGGYLDEIHKMTDKLDEAYDRSRMLEEFVVWFKSSQTAFDAMNGKVAESATKIDLTLSRSMEVLNDHITGYNEELTKHMTTQRQAIASLIDEQTNAIQGKVTELNSVVNELRNLSEMKKSIDRLEKVINSQNENLELLTEAIIEHEGVDGFYSYCKRKVEQYPWLKIVVPVVVCLILLLFVLNQIISLIA